MDDLSPDRNALCRADARRGKFDVVAVWRFDRFARSTRFLLETLEEFNNLGIDFVSLRESIDTSSATGKLVFTILGAVAELERSTIRERVIAGQKAARRRGVRFGRPNVEVDEDEVRKAAQQGAVVARNLYDHQESGPRTPSSIPQPHRKGLPRYTYPPSYGVGSAGSSNFCKNHVHMA